MTGTKSASARKRRRADGALRPAVRRYRRKRNGPLSDERKAWLARFEPGARNRFFKFAFADQAVWLRGFAAELGIPETEAWPMLEKVANERSWMKLRLATGQVVGIAPPRRRKQGCNPKAEPPEFFADWTFGAISGPVLLTDENIERLAAAGHGKLVDGRLQFYCGPWVGTIHVGPGMYLFKRDDGGYFARAVPDPSSPR